MDSQAWQFCIDRGGTFTDIVARTPHGQIVTHKLLSDNPEQYADAAVAGIRAVLGLTAEQPLPSDALAAVKMGTTVATNALLEHQGAATALLITQGFADALRIAYQNRPQLFARQIVLPQLLYQQVLEVEERLAADGQVLQPLQLAPLRPALQQLRTQGIQALAIVLLHSYRNPQHELQLAELARELGFAQISLSHQVSPLIKLIGRGDTTVVDAYLSPVLRRYIDQLSAALQGVRVQFMQSNGGLTEASHFHGKDAILSGPAGGMVAAVATAQTLGIQRLIAFDMGGTSTDVAHYAGELERSVETLIAGVRIRAPMLHIHTVAAGGGSICSFDGQRLRVGPQSAGANPGPLCYRRGGPLTVTDCNLLLGRVQAQFFPALFGPQHNQPLDRAAVEQQLQALAVQVSQATGVALDAPQLAEGLVRIAVENMANAIKKISTQRGYAVSDYTLVCFGGAGGQHACAVAEALGMRQVLIHPLAGVLSAYGMGLAAIRNLQQHSLELPLQQTAWPQLQQQLQQLQQRAAEQLIQQGWSAADWQLQRRLRLRYSGSDTSLILDYADLSTLETQFHARHQQRYGFRLERPLLIEAAEVELSIAQDLPLPVLSEPRTQPLQPCAQVALYLAGAYQSVPLYRREQLHAADQLHGPALISDAGATHVLEPGWSAQVQARGELLLTQHHSSKPHAVAVGTQQADPILLEIFNNLFMSIAEQMGYTLANTAHSVNIKERLDFSCALFDAQGQLIANAPHMPVHLGSMGETVQAVVRDHPQMQPGDVFASNAPYNGGTHLPDVTVITPVFSPDGRERWFYVASRGHHADIGGATPGSMPADSQHIEQEGVLLDGFKLVEQGNFCEAALVARLSGGRYPVRNLAQNLADLQAQIAANTKGVQELQRLVAHYGLAVVQAYMQHVQDNAEEQVRRVLARLSSGQFRYAMDNGSVVQVRVEVEQAARRARIDFTGTSAQQPNNFNAPLAVTKAAVLYVFRTLVDEDIPLNAGCLKPLEMHVPAGCMLNPHYPAAVVAGNVETSQVVTDALYGALGVMAAAQGTMNNLTFGNAHYQYYETLCGGSGAGPGFAGTAAVHTHMTNSRLTDPEVLELRFPVRLEQFSIRHGSGGAGQYRGGDGVIRKLRFLQPMTVSVLSNRRVVAPFGLAGGQPGQCGANWLERADAARVALASCAQVELQAGEAVVIETPGGGGFGHPLPPCP